MGERLIDLVFQAVGIVLLIDVKRRTDFGGQGEARGHREPEVAHFGKICPLAAQQGAHLGGAIGNALAKPVDPFRRGISHRPPRFAFRSIDPGVFDCIETQMLPRIQRLHAQRRGSGQPAALPQGVARLRLDP